MKLYIDEQGNVSAVHVDGIEDFLPSGERTTERVSDVEWKNGSWQADMSRIGGPVVASEETRGAAIEREVEWLEQNMVRLVNGSVQKKGICRAFNSQG